MNIMNITKLINIMFGFVITLTSTNLYAQTVTTVPRADVLSLIGAIEHGTPLVEPYPYYYEIWHDYNQTEASLKAKMPKYLDILLATQSEVKATETIDSVTTRRAEICLADEADKSTLVGDFFDGEKNRLVKLIGELEEKVEWITPNGGSVNLLDQWQMRCKSIRNGISVAEKERMTAINRKKIYVDLYNDASKYNEELDNLLQYLGSIKQLEDMAKAKHISKVNKSKYITYGRSRWVTACQLSMSKKNSN